MTETETRGRVRAYIIENFLYTRPHFSFGDDDSLLRKGVFDSLGAMEVLEFVGNAWRIHVPETDITEANFGTVAGIARYITTRAA